jgi:hypothetical protein
MDSFNKMNTKNKKNLPDTKRKDKKFKKLNFRVKISLNLTETESLGLNDFTMA